MKKYNFQETQKFNPLERIQSPPAVDTSMWFEFNVKALPGFNKHYWD